MGEEASLYYVGGRIGGYRNTKGGDTGNGNGNFYRRFCFERLGKEEDNRGNFVVMLSAATETKA